MPIFMHLFYYVIVIVKLDWLVCMLDLGRLSPPPGFVLDVWKYFLKRRHSVFCDLFFLVKNFIFLVVVRFIYCYSLTKFVFLWCLGLISVPTENWASPEFLSNFFWSEGHGYDLLATVSIHFDCIFSAVTTKKIVWLG